MDPADRSRDHRRAAAARGWPLADKWAWESGLCALPSLASPPPELEQAMRKTDPGLSLDPLRRQWQDAWYPGRRGHGIGEFLAFLAKDHLRRAGTHYALAASASVDEPDAVERWRWLSLEVPSFILIAALENDLAPGRPSVPLAGQPRLVSPHAARVLEPGVSETHLHLGAAIRFAALWSNAMSDVRDPKQFAWLGDSALPPECPFGDKDSFRAMMRAASLVRLVLANATRELEAGRKATLETVLADLTRSDAGLRDWLDEAVRLVLGIKSSRDARRNIGGLALTLRRLTVWRKALPAPRGVPDPDPLAEWLGPRTPTEANAPQFTASVETRFVTRAWRLGEGAADQPLAVLFWQYLRVVTRVWRYVRVEPGTSGLDWFKRHYDRASELRGTLDRRLWAEAWATTGDELNLTSLEARVAPANRWSDLSRGLSVCAAEATGRSRGAEVGVVVHFIKDAPQPSQRRPRPPERWRHGDWYRANRKRVIAVRKLLEYRPESLFLLRGLDIASLELTLPTWAYAPFFSELRATSELASASLRLRGAIQRLRGAPSSGPPLKPPSGTPPPFGLTAHCGEDFRTVLEGLRRVHELEEVGLLQPGDRLGHALALGLDANRHASRVGTVFQPAEERLQDLLWELKRYRQTDFPPPIGRYIRLEREIHELGHRVFQEDLTLDQLLDWREALLDPRWLPRLGFPYAPSVPSDLAGQRLLRYLTDPSLRARGDEPVSVRPEDDELAAAAAGQQWLRRRLALREITVEANPSSNLLVGELGDTLNHPALVLQPLPGRPAAPGGPVLLSLNSDDPLTFVTRLADEYAYIYAALIRAGVTTQDALAWIGQVRDNGVRSRFTVPETRSAETLGWLETQLR